MSDATPKPNPRGRRAELYAALIVGVLGAPLIFLYARAMAEGETRRREAPMRAILGDESFERLARGERTPEHYFGDSLLAPDFTLMDRNGRPWHLRDHRGKVVVLNFWTITCQPCVEELPSVLELADIAQHRSDVEVVAVSTDENWSSVAALFPPKFSLQVLFDPERKIVRDKYGTRLFPETWVIDRRGVIRLRVDGRRNWSEALSLDAIESFL